MSAGIVAPRPLELQSAKSPFPEPLARCDLVAAAKRHRSPYQSSSTGSYCSTGRGRR